VSTASARSKDDVGRLIVAAFRFDGEGPAARARHNAGDLHPGRSCFGVYRRERRRRRLSDHAADPTKAFAREAYLIYGYRRDWFDKTAAIDLQARLTEIAEQAALVEVVRGTNPQVLELPEDERASLETFVQNSLRLLFDAGCSSFHSCFASQRRSDTEAETAIAPEEAGPIHIDVPTDTPHEGELELSYVGLWARGYPAEGGGFVVMAGSEARGIVNPSADHPHPPRGACGSRWACGHPRRAGSSEAVCAGVVSLGGHRGQGTVWCACERQQVGRAPPSAADPDCGLERGLAR
jgi:hypothetical protein